MQVRARTTDGQTDIRRVNGPQLACVRCRQGAEVETSQYAEVVVIKKRDRPSRSPATSQRPPAAPPVYAEITHQPIYFNQI